MQCIKYYCPLGLTRADRGSYRLVTQLPDACENPFIIAEKEGYLKSKKQLVDTKSITLPMTRLKCGLMTKSCFPPKSNVMLHPGYCSNPFISKMLKRLVITLFVHLWSKPTVPFTRDTNQSWSLPGLRPWNLMMRCLRSRSCPNWSRYGKWLIG